MIIQKNTEKKFTVKDLFLESNMVELKKNWLKFINLPKTRDDLPKHRRYSKDKTQDQYSFKTFSEFQDAAYKRYLVLNKKVSVGHEIVKNADVKAESDYELF